jgi:hypothetical protein
MIQIKTQLTRRELRQFGWVWLVFWLLVGWLVRHQAGAPRAGAAIWGFGLASGLAGFCFPSVMRLCYDALVVVLSPLGWVLSRLVMGLVYFGVVTPIGFLVRMVAGDPMRRRLDPAAKSYWTPLDESATKKEYFHQY